MSSYDIQSDFKEINRHWDALQEILENEAYCAIQDDSVSGWDCGKQAGHSVLTLEVIGMGILNNLANPDQFKDESPSDFMPQVFDGGKIPRGAGQAPDFIDPKDRTREEFLLMLNKTKETWVELENRMDELDACPAKFPHFAFGYLTSAKWVRFISMHTLHHLYIIRDILAAVPDGSSFGNELKV